MATEGQIPFKNIGADLDSTEDLPTQTPAFQTAESLRQEAADRADLRGPAKR